MDSGDALALEVVVWCENNSGVAVLVGGPGARAVNRKLKEFYREVGGMVAFEKGWYQLLAGCCG